MKLVVRRSTVLAAAVLLLALSSCGDDQERAGGGTEPAPSGSTDVTDEPSPSTASSPPASDQSDSGTSALPFPGDELSAREFADVVRAAFGREATAQVELTVPAIGARVEGVADYSGKRAALDLTGFMADLGGEFMMRLVDDSVYVSAPGEQAWLRFGLDDRGNPLAAMARHLAAGAMFADLERGIRSAEYLGVETFDNLSMNGYVAKARTALLTDLPTELIGSAQVPETVTYEAYVDGGGSLGGFVTDVGSKFGPITMEFSEWGESVSVVAPPSDQVTPAPGA